MQTLRSLLAAAVPALLATAAPAQNPIVSAAINQLGLDLLRAQAAESATENLLLSPYSIETALAMAYAGAEGQTHAEMQRVMHLPAEDEAVFGGFAELTRQLAELQKTSRERAQAARREGLEQDPIELNIANRLFAQRGYPLRASFKDLLRDRFEAPLQELDFRTAVEPARVSINAWVAQQTRDRIRDLIAPGALDSSTSAVLVNALYLKAPWADAFEPELTSDEPFWVNGTTRVSVPTMRQQEDLRYEKREHFAFVGLPYLGGGLQFLIVLPDQRDGIAAIERELTAEILASGAKLPQRDVILRLPKFKLEPPSLALGDLLRGLGMKTAFDQPQGSANFDRMAPRSPDEYLAISEVFHQTWLALDEQGTEAAAATAVAMVALSAAPNHRPPPVEVHVDRPFLFAIQHVASGACLFLGRVTDPR